jgi:glyoxylase-like metal-dependent hydrolase (beta-lactamase superfamily II)
VGVSPAPAPASTSLDYPFAAPPATGGAIEVAPGVLWLRMPMPFRLDHINLWAIRDTVPVGDGRKNDDRAHGWAIVDTGLQTPESIAAWRALFADGGALAGARITRVIVTHMHPDHVGMAGWLTEKFDVRLAMTRLEYLNCRVLVNDTGRDAPDEGIRFYSRAGWDAEALEMYRARFGEFGRWIHRLPDSYVRLSDGQLLIIGEHTWEVIVGAGHSPEHACLLCRDLGVFISGDQVLPRISSNVSVFPTEPEADPLSDWMSSIDRIRARVGPDVLVLPSHNEPFRGLHRRLDALANGHLTGLDRLRERLAQPQRVVDVFPALFRRTISAGRELTLATGESIAHLNTLIVHGEAERMLGDDGVYQYRARSR